jgi:hypothetical protein
MPTRRFIAFGTAIAIAGGLTGYLIATVPRVVGRGATVEQRDSLSLHQLLADPGELLQHRDIAMVNLLCADGLSEAKNLDVATATATLDSWAKRVESETQRHLPKFKQRPEEFNHSEAYFRMLALVTVLQQDFGVRYNPERIQSPDFADSRELFLHGLLTGKRQGTCVSMPVLYVAVGRRLGYARASMSDDTAYADLEAVALWEKAQEQFRNSTLSHAMLDVLLE